MYSYQNIGVSDFTTPTRTIIIHEFAHTFLGGNEFHTSGGNHYGTYTACPFIGLQGGWGLIGGYASSLISCNAYERWRLGWFSKKYNPQQYDIAANGKNSDISKETGEQQFILRDFITTGDAVRIKFPYTDPGASNQYLWLENHQVGKNNKFDFLVYSNSSECRDAGSAGIYSYIQVGRDVIESDNFKDIYPGDETDNLKVVNAKGNWDVELVTAIDTLNCVAWRSVQHSESYYKPNPLSGYVDEQSHFFDPSGTLKKISDKGILEYPGILYRDGIRYENLPYLGDNSDAFTGISVMDIGSNPAPINAVTYYVTQGGKNFKAYKKTNTRHCYLSGLNITMKDLNDGTFNVAIRWDDYAVKNNVRWTGNIILSEQLNLQKGKTILLDQNYTPNQLERDSSSGFFAPLTTLTAKNNSILELGAKAKIVIDNGSSLILEANSRLILQKKSQIILKKNARVVIKQGAVIDYRGGKIRNKSNGKIIKEP